MLSALLIAICTIYSFFCSSVRCMHEKMLYNWAYLFLSLSSKCTWINMEIWQDFVNEIPDLIVRWSSTAWASCVCELRRSWCLNPGCPTQSFLSGGWKTVQVDTRDKLCPILSEIGWVQLWHGTTGKYYGKCIRKVYKEGRRIKSKTTFNW